MAGAIGTRVCWMAGACVLRSRAARVLQEAGGEQEMGQAEESRGFSWEPLLVPCGDKCRQAVQTDNSERNSDFWEWWP